MTIRDELIGWAQVLLSVLFLVGYFLVLVGFLAGWWHPPAEWKDAVIALLGVITGAVGVIISFWFSRSRHEPETA
jgi:predicted tellurium resistance membrane protein TerC